MVLVRFDQYSFFPLGENGFLLENNYYDDRRPESDYVDKASVASRFTRAPYISLFIRYNADDNARINSNCPEVKPLKNEGFNAMLKFKLGNGLQIRSENFEEEDHEALLQCLSELYEVSINDTIFNDLRDYFVLHPAKGQRGITATISTRDFKDGENVIQIKKRYLNASDSLISRDFAHIPIWFSKD